MAQVWKCKDCGYSTQDPRDAGDHERDYNDGRLATYRDPHFMEDPGE